MGKKSILIVTGLALVAVGGQVLTKSRYSSVIENQFASLKQAYGIQGISLSRQIVEESMLGAKDTVTITLGEEYLSQYGTDYSQPVDITLDNECTFLPFYVVCDSTLTKLADLKAFSPTMDYSVNVLFNTLDGNVGFDKTVISENDGTLTVNPFSLNYNTDLSFDEITVEMDWQGASLVGSSSGSDVTIGNVGLTATSSKVFDNVYASDVALTVNSLEMASTTYGTRLNLQNARLTSAFNEEADNAFALDYKVAVEKIRAENQQMNITDFVLDIGLDNISRETMAYLNSDTQNDESAYVELMLKEFGQTEHTIHINALDLKLSDVPLKTSGAFTLAPYDMSDIENSVLTEKLSGDVIITIGKDIVSAFPVAKPVIQQYLEQGLLSDEPDHYQVKVTLGNGAVKANSVPVYQL